MTERWWHRLTRRSTIATARLGQSLSIKVDDELLSRLADEQLRQVWSHATVGTVIATLFAVVMAWHFESQLPAVWVQYWLIAKLAVAAPRILQAQIYRHAAHAGGARWRRWTYGLLALDGVVWGLGGAGAVLLADTAVASLVIACLASIACVATFGLQVRMLATASYVVPIIGLTALGLLARQDEFGHFGGPGLVLFLTVLISTAMRSEKSMAETFLLREQTIRIADELKAALELARQNAAERGLALEHANRESAAKSQFLATMSHELRTPLHGILGLSRLLRDEMQQHPATKRLDLIEASADHLLGLINELLDLSRIEAGHLVLRPSEFNLYEQLEAIAGVYAVRAEEKGLQFRAELAIDEDCWVNGDAARVRQVLHNLLGNAVKFTEVGYVSLQATTGPDGQLIVDVRDTGVGIPEESQATVFDKFCQAEAPGKSPLEGTGLGLTIARELARAMGGDITFVSTRGLGSSFRCTMTLPRVVHAQAASQAVVSITGARRASRQGRHVLLAEDNDVNAIVATEYLEREGLIVERVSNGRDALQACTKRSERPDLVFMDVRMPVMDGISAVRAVRERERDLGLPRLPILALTATTTRDELARCIDAGMDGCLAKPFSREELTAKLARWLDHKPAAVEGALLSSVN